MVTKNRLNILNKKGVSLIFVILVLLVMTILGVAVFTLFSSNIAQAKYQDDSIRAHFIAISGVEIAFAALLEDDKAIIEDYFDKPDDQFEALSSLSDTLVFDNGTAEIEIEAQIIDDLRFVVIHSVGTLNGSTIQRELIMRFRVEYPEIQFWD